MPQIVLRELTHYRRNGRRRAHRSRGVSCPRTRCRRTRVQSGRRERSSVENCELQRRLGDLIVRVLFLHVSSLRRFRARVRPLVTQGMLPEALEAYLEAYHAGAESQTEARRRTWGGSVACWLIMGRGWGRKSKTLSGRCLGGSVLHRCSWA